MISDRDARWRIRETLKARGFRPDRFDPTRYHGAIEVGHQTISVTVEVRDSSFQTLPKVFLDDPAALGWDVLAHTQESTGVCYAPAGFYHLDPYRPGAAVLRVLADVETTLLQSAGGRGRNEVTREYAAYWRNPIYHLLSPRPLDNTVQTFVRSDNRSFGPMMILANSGAEVPSGYRLLGRPFGVVRCKEAVGPAGGVFTPKTFAELISWLAAHQCEGNLKAVCENAVEQRSGIVIEAANGFFGARFDVPARYKMVKGARPGFLKKELGKHASEFKLDRFVAEPADLESVVTRSLPENDMSLGAEKVCLVGCGAIGGHLAKLLAQLGAGSKKVFTLIDPEMLKAGNIGRHALGFDSLDRNKAEGMADELRRFHPDIRVDSISQKFADVIEYVFRHDIIIDATGIENVSLSLNERAIRARSSSKPPILVHAFLFGYGIAAQSFINPGPNRACFRCLKPEMTGEWRYDPRKAEAKDMPPIDTGCGDGVFLPYGPYAGAFAAALVARHLHQWVGGQSSKTLLTQTIDFDLGKRIEPKEIAPHLSCPACQTVC